MSSYFKNFTIKSCLRPGFLIKLLVSLAFAVSTCLDSHLAYSDNLYAAADRILFLPRTSASFVKGALGFIAIFAIISLLELLQKKLNFHYDVTPKEATRKDLFVWLLFFFLLICAWSPYLLSYFPGGIYPDTETCIGQAQSGAYNNQQPIFYSLLFKLCLTVAGRMNTVAVFSIFQVVFMACCFSYILFRLYLHNVNKPVLIVIFAYFALFNLVPLYVVSIWKDTLFSTTLLMYIFLLFENVIMSGRKPAPRKIALIILFMVLTVFLRNNGIYVMLLTTIILAIAFRKTLMNAHKAFFSVTAIALIFCFTIQGPVFNSFELNGPFVENLGVLQQQVAYVEVIGGDITPEEMEFLNKICPEDIMKAYYRPLIIDTIKWCEDYDTYYLENHKGKFLKVWASMLTRNPKLYVDAYLYITLGYWNPFKQSVVSYVNPEMWPELQNVDCYWQLDPIAMLTGASIRESLSPKTLISSAVFLFISLVLFALSANKKDKRWLVFIPALATYLTVFIATPLAFALRYVYIVVLTVPLFVFIAFLQCSSTTTQSTDEAL